MFAHYLLELEPSKKVLSRRFKYAIMTSPVTTFILFLLMAKLAYS